MTAFALDYNETKKTIILRHNGEPVGEYPLNADNIPEVAAELVKRMPGAKLSELTSELAKLLDGNWPDPEPLPVGLPAVAAYAQDMLPASLRPWVRDASERMQCPAEYVAVAMVVCAGSLIGKKVILRPKRQDDWQVVPNLWGLLIGAPSLMKSPAMREAMRTIHAMQAAAAADHQAAMTEHNAGNLLADATAKLGKATIEKMLKNGDPVQARKQALQLAAEQDAPAPAEKVYIVNDATVEALGVVLNNNPNGTLIGRDEIVGWLRNMDREGHENDRAFYLQCWDGLGSYSYRRITRGTLHIESAIVSVLGTIQPGVLADYIRQAVDGGIGDDGLVQRFQLAVWPDNPPTWENIDRWPDKDARAAADAALRHLDELTAESVGAERDSIDADDPPYLRFDAAAQSLFDNWHTKLMRHCRSGIEPPAIESHLMKYKKLVPALSLIFHLVEGDSGPVQVGALKLALRWAEFLESHARRVYAVVGNAPTLAANLLAERIKAGDLPQSFTARDIYRRNWAGLDKERTGYALDVLAALNWLDESTDTTGGRPMTRYRVNPKVSNTQGDGVTKVTKGGSEGAFVTFVTDHSYESENIDPEFEPSAAEVVWEEI